MQGNWSAGFPALVFRQGRIWITLVAWQAGFSSGLNRLVSGHQHMSEAEPHTAPYLSDKQNVSLSLNDKNSGAQFPPSGFQIENKIASSFAKMTSKHIGEPHVPVFTILLGRYLDAHIPVWPGLMPVKIHTTSCQKASPGLERGRPGHRIVQA
jgi:hypothetical protein